MPFSEDSRVKIPVLLHFTCLGYRYLSLKDSKWDEDSNIFPDLFAEAMRRINTGSNPDEIARTLRDISLDLENEDLGRAFYQRLLDPTGLRLIDFENFDNNTFYVVTELPCINDDEEFRPDITLLINGLPLVFLEVKKPNNREGSFRSRGLTVHEVNSRDEFAKDIKSIQDGYSLRLIREEIETEYKLQLKKTLDQIEILRGGSNRTEVYADP